MLPVFCRSLWSSLPPPHLPACLPDFSKESERCYCSLIFQKVRAPLQLQCLYFPRFPCHTWCRCPRCRSQPRRPGRPAGPFPAAPRTRGKRNLPRRPADSAEPRPRCRTGAVLGQEEPHTTLPRNYSDLPLPTWEGKGERKARQGSGAAGTYLLPLSFGCPAQ